MITEVADTVRSLISIMQEESNVLSRGAAMGVVNELAAAKIRLAANLEAQIAQLDRERGDWRNALDEADKLELLTAIDELQEASARNADILRRQIDLSVEMMGAIAAEAKRLSGTRSQTYGASGSVFRQDLPTPISVNTSL